MVSVFIDIHDLRMLKEHTLIVTSNIKNERLKAYIKDRHLHDGEKIDYKDYNDWRTKKYREFLKTVKGKQSIFGRDFIEYLRCEK